MISLTRLKSDIQAISRQFKVGGCEQCQSQTAFLRPGRTAYDTSKIDLETEGDPNGPVYLCDQCAKEFNDYWDEMWNEYNQSRG